MVLATADGLKSQANRSLICYFGAKRPHLRIAFASDRLQRARSDVEQEASKIRPIVVVQMPRPSAVSGLASGSTPIWSVGDRMFVPFDLDEAVSLTSEVTLGHSFQTVFAFTYEA